MRYFNRIGKPISIWLIVSILNLYVWPLYSWAGSTEANFTANQEQSVFADRERLKDLVQRQEVLDELMRYGVTQEEALARIDALTDEEVVEINGKLNQLPAGGYYVAAAMMPAGAAYVFLFIWIPVDTLVITTKGIGCAITFTCSYLGGWAFVGKGYFYDFHKSVWRHDWLHKMLLLNAPTTTFADDYVFERFTDPNQVEENCLTNVYTNFSICMKKSENYQKEQVCETDKQAALEKCDMDGGKKESK